MTTLRILIAALCILSCLTACKNEPSTQIKVGIILPLEHKSLQDIVTGFSTQLKAIYHQDVQIKVMNAQGDANMQRAIIQQMRDQQYSLIVPIATGATQMASAMIHDKPLLGLANKMTEAERQALHPCNLAVVHDEIPVAQSIAFIHAVYPKLTHLTLIHSTSDTIFSDVKAAILAGKQRGIEVKPLMVATLPDLISATQAIPSQTQALFILKDNLIASGISTLVQISHQKNIPLITSDEGSVINGANYALGVHEYQIGAEGATLAAAILAGKSACSLPIVDMKKLTVFIHSAASSNLENITTAAKKLNYQIEFVKGD